MTTQESDYYADTIWCTEEEVALLVQDTSDNEEKHKLFEVTRNAIKALVANDWELDSTVADFVGQPNAVELYSKEIYQDPSAGPDQMDAAAADLKREALKQQHGVQSLVDDKDVTAADVLLGRGGHCNHHNKHYLRLVAEKVPEYRKPGTSNPQKTEIAEKIIADISKNQGRFLRQVGEKWIEVKGRAVKEKVMRALRPPRQGC